MQAAGRARPVHRAPAAKPRCSRAEGASLRRVVIVAVCRVPNAIRPRRLAVSGELQDTEEERSDHCAADDDEEHVGATLFGTLAALLVFLTAPARARIVAPDFLHKTSCARFARGVGAINVRFPALATDRTVSLSDRTVSLSDRTVCLSDRTVSLSHRTVTLSDRTFLRQIALSRV